MVFFTAWDIISLLGRKPVKRPDADSLRRACFIFSWSKNNQRLLFWPQIIFEHQAPPYLNEYNFWLSANESRVAPKSVVPLQCLHLCSPSIWRFLLLYGYILHVLCHMIFFTWNVICNTMQKFLVVVSVWNRGKYFPWFPLWTLPHEISYTCPSQAAVCGTPGDESEYAALWAIYERSAYQ